MKKRNLLDAALATAAILGVSYGLTERHESKQALNEQERTFQAVKKVHDDELTEVKSLYAALQQDNEKLRETKGNNEEIEKLKADVANWKANSDRLQKIVEEDDKILNNPKFSIKYWEMPEDPEYYSLTITDKTKGSYLIPTDATEWTRDQAKFLGDSTYKTVTVENVIE